MYMVVQDFNTPLVVAEHMAKTSDRVYDPKVILEEISVDMVRVTDELWKSQGSRGGGRWKPLAPATVQRKGNNLVLYTKGSDPRYTPHEGDDVLADSVTKVGGAHQILVVNRSSIEFGTDVEYANRQFKSRPFIRFEKRDIDRWSRMILGFAVEPLREPTVGIGVATEVSAFGGGFMLRGAGGRFTGVIR